MIVFIVNLFRTIYAMYFDHTLCLPVVPLLCTLLTLFLIIGNLLSLMGAAHTHIGVGSPTEAPAVH